MSDRVPILLLTGVSALLCQIDSVQSHELRPGYLEIHQAETDIFDILWKVPAKGELRLGLYVRMPDSCTELGNPVSYFTEDAFVKRWRCQCEGSLVGEVVAIDGLATTKTDVLARVQWADGASQTERLDAARTSFTIEAAPGLLQIASAYTVLGVEHILTGIDHLLFVLALVLLVRGWKQIVGTVTSFTIAHSITLAAATLGWVRVPGPPVEACIALSIVFVAAEIIRSRQGNPTLTEQAPWLIAFTFGLLHGLGFAGALADVGLPEQAIPIALLFFNIGVEIGQLGFVFVVLVVFLFMKQFSFATFFRRWNLLPYGIGTIAMFWVIERTIAFL